MACAFTAITAFQLKQRSNEGFIRDSSGESNFNSSQVIETMGPPVFSIHSTSPPNAVWGNHSPSSSQSPPVGLQLGPYQSALLLLSVAYKHPLGASKGASASPSPLGHQKNIGCSFTASLYPVKGRGGGALLTCPALSAPARPHPYSPS